MVISVLWSKCGQNVAKFGGYKKQDLVKCLKINNLQSLVVPRMGIEPIRPFRAKGFSYHYGFRHHFCLWSGLFLHLGAMLFERCEEGEEVISRKTIEDSIDGENAEAYRILLDGEKVGGVVLRIDKAAAKGELELLFVLPEVHSKGIGQAAWKAVEAMHPEIKVWETITPYFEKRNIHFYVNRCGFHIVEFWNKYQHGPAVPEEEVGNWSMDDEMFVFRKVITDKGAIRESD